MLHKDELHGYQSRGVQHIVDHDAAALWMEIGTGKTVTALTAIEDLMDQCQVYGTLVVAPLRICQAVWAQEARSWYHTKKLTFSLITGSPKQRMNALHRKADIHLINYENLVWLGEQLKRFWLSQGKHLPFNMVVFDELSKMSNSTSKRVKAFCRILPYTTRRIGLTGTPATNGLVKLHGQYLVLDAGQRLGPHKTKFEAKYFESDYMGYKLILRPGAEEAIRHAIQGITYQVSAKDYLELPSLNIQDIEIQFTPDARDTYDEMEKEFFTEVGGEAVEAFSQAAKSLKCLQICNGAMYIDEQKDFVEVHSAKLDALEDIIEEMAGRALLVCYSFRSDAARIKKRFKEAVDVRDHPADEIVEAWNRGEIPLLIGHPASMGHGLNLQYGGNHLAWYGLNWDLELYEQAIGRLHRQGQAHPVFVHRLMMENSLEQVVSEALENKGNVQQAIKNAIKKHQE